MGELEIVFFGIVLFFFFFLGGGVGIFALIIFGIPLYITWQVVKLMDVFLDCSLKGNDCGEEGVGYLLEMTQLIASIV